MNKEIKSQLGIKSGEIENRFIRDFDIFESHRLGVMNTSLNVEKL